MKRLRRWLTPRAGRTGGRGVPAAPQIITRLTPASIGPYVQSDLPTDHYTPGTYASSADPGNEAVTASWFINGSPWDETSTVLTGQSVTLQESVTDTVPTTPRVFTYGPQVTAALPPADEIILGDGPALTRLLEGQELQDSVTWDTYTAASGFTLAGGTPPREMRINGGAWETYVATTVVAANSSYQVRDEPSTTNVPPVSLIFESSIEIAQAVTLTETTSLTGTVELGETVTAGSVSWNITPTAVQYRWLRDGEVISGATAQAYTIVTADVLTDLMPQARAETTGVPFSQWFDLLDDAAFVPRVMPVFTVDWGAASYANGASITVANSAFDVTLAGTPAYTPSTGDLTLLVDSSPVTLPHTAVTDQSMRWLYEDVLADTTISVLGAERRVVAADETVVLPDLEFTTETGDEDINFAPLFPVGATSWGITSTPGVSINTSGVATFATNEFADGEITVTSDLGGGTFDLSKIPLTVASTGETVQVTFGADTRDSATITLTVDDVEYTLDRSDNTALTVGDFKTLIAERGVPVTPATIIFTNDLGEPGAVDDGDALAVLQAPIWAYTISPPVPVRQWVDDAGSIVGATATAYTADGDEDATVAVTFSDGSRTVTSNTFPVADPAPPAATVITPGDTILTVTSLADLDPVTVTAGDTILTVEAA